MKKNSVLIIFLAALLTLAFSSPSGIWSLDIPSAFASDDDSKDKDKDKDEDKDKDGDKDKDKDGGSEESPTSCECPPGISSCVCADNTPGSPGGTGGGGGGASPSSQRGLHGQ